MKVWILDAVSYLPKAVEGVRCIGHEEGGFKFGEKPIGEDV